MIDGIEKLPDKSSGKWRKWIGNDSIRQHYFARVNRNEYPLNLELHWKQNANSSPTLIGYYSFDLESLLSAGYIRTAPKNCIDSKEVILRFQRTDNEIQISINRKTKAKKIGWWSPI
ncbi:MAG: hypothetical protein WCK32_10095 [Chlorobiaceae bacterium]